MLNLARSGYFVTVFTSVVITLPGTRLCLSTFSYPDLSPLDVTVMVFYFTETAVVMRQHSALLKQRARSASQHQHGTSTASPCTASATPVQLSTNHVDTPRLVLLNSLFPSSSLPKTLTRSAGRGALNVVELRIAHSPLLHKHDQLANFCLY